MGAAISLFDGARAIRVSPLRFAPVKSCADLLAVRSDAYRLSEDFRVLPAPDGPGDALVVELDPAYFGRVDQLDARTPHGPPSLVRARRLVVRGDVRFGRDVAVEGEVELAAPAGATRVIPDGSVLRGPQLMRRTSGRSSSRWSRTFSASSAEGSSSR